MLREYMRSDSVFALQGDYDIDVIPMNHA